MSMLAGGFSSRQLCACYSCMLHGRVVHCRHICIFACMSKRDQRTEEVCFWISAFPCQHSGARDPPTEALGWAS